MNIGVPKEIKSFEHRVGLTPQSISALVDDHHTVFIQSQAGKTIGFDDSAYQQVGAKIVDSLADLYDVATLIVKVKEPQAEEYSLLNSGHILFGYLHLAAEPILTQALQESGALCLGYETVVDAQGKLPLLKPMSEIAGRLSIQAAAQSLETTTGGMGILLSGATGVSPLLVVIIGGGIVGTNAAMMAMGLGARVVVLDQNLSVLSVLAEHYFGRLTCVYATDAAVFEWVVQADVVIGAVLVMGDTSPHVIHADWLSKMKSGAVIVDVAIDQGGCVATSHPTTHQQPRYRVDDVIHYCVTNMPSAVAKTATQALSAAILPYVKTLANAEKAKLALHPELWRAVNVLDGKIVHPTVKKALQG